MSEQKSSPGLGSSTSSGDCRSVRLLVKTMCASLFLLDTLLAAPRGQVRLRHSHRPRPSLQHPLDGSTTCVDLNAAVKSPTKARGTLST